MIDRERLLSEVKALPTLSSAVARLSGLVNDPRATGSDYEAAIKHDLAVTGNVLRIANSAFFRRGRGVESVRQAFLFLGAKRVFEIAVAASVSAVIPPRLPGYGVSARSFWLHSVSVAILAERLAAELTLRNLPELTFTAGLLHDAGKLVIGAFLEENEEERHTIDIESMPFIDIERRILGVDHAEIGAEIARRWSLPNAVIWAAEFHHRPDEAPAEAALLVDLIHVADGMSYVLGFGSDVGELSRRIGEQAVDRLGLKLPNIEHAASQTLDEIRDLAALFATSMGEES